MARANSGSNQNTLTYAVVAWGGIAATTCFLRWFKQRSVQARENRIAEGNGLMPQCRNAIEALAWRASNTPDKLALEAADGATKYTWMEYYQEVECFARSLLAIQGTSATKDQQHGVAVHAFNEPRWFFSALGALAAEWTISGIFFRWAPRNRTKTYIFLVFSLTFLFLKLSVSTEYCRHLPDKYISSGSACAEDIRCQSIGS